jgi:2'-5' RNA ligase
VTPEEGRRGTDLRGGAGRRRHHDPDIPGRRLFIALPLPDDAVTAVTDVVDVVRGQGLPDGARDVRWVRLDGLHLTLRFLGPTPESRVTAAGDAVRAASIGAAPIRLELGGAGSFPRSGRPRTLWIGLTAGAADVEALAGRVAAALEAAGWPADPRPVRAHLTLARSDGVAAGSLVAGRLAEAMATRRIGASVHHLGLFESITGGGPARYVPLVTVPLGDPG